MDGWKKFYSVGITAEELCLILQQGANPNHSEYMQPPLHVSCIRDDLVQTEILLQHGADPNLLYDRYAPLHLCARRGKVETVKLLLRYGANIDLQDVKGWTALHQSVFFLDTVRCLLEHGAETELLTKDGKSALQLAEEAQSVGKASAELITTAKESAKAN